MVKLDKTIGGFFGVIVSRYEDDEKINTFLSDVLPVYEEMCKSSNGKFLMGTDDITYIDIHIASLWDSMFTGVLSPAHSDGAEKLDLKNKAPNWWAYMERVRDHPQL